MVEARTKPCDEIFVHKLENGIGHSEFDKELGEMDVGIVVNIGNPDDHEGDEKKSEFDLKVYFLNFVTD